MNIFRLDDTPGIAALYHCDSHVVKMVLETAQLLSTAHHVIDGPRSDLCRPTHANHPLAVWARQSTANYEWLHQLGVALCRHYTGRYRREHAYRPMYDLLAGAPAGVPSAPATPQPQCMPERYKSDDAVHAYRLYYVGDKLRFARWRYSAPPPWLDEYLAHLDNL